MVTFGTDLDPFLRELEIQGERNDAEQKDRQKKFLNLERPTAELLYLLLQASRRKNILEIGTSNGFKGGFSEVEGPVPHIPKIRVFTSRVAT